MCSEQPGLLQENDMSDFVANQVPQDPRQLAPALVKLSKTVRALAALKMAEFGLQVGEDEIVLALQENRIADITQLSAELVVRFPTMLKNIDRLVERGVVSRVAGPLVKLTDRGAAMVSQIISFQRGLEFELSDMLGPESTSRLVNSLEELQAALTQILRT